MASKNEETKKVSTKKTTSTKTSSSKKTNTTKSAPKKSTPNKSVEKKSNKPKKINKDLEKTVIIQDIENKINNIVENKNTKVKEEIIEEVKIENIAKLENAKYPIRKRNKNLLAIGVLISILGIVALIITLVANRVVDKEFISDNAIVLMVIASILIEFFGAFIIINES